MSLADYLSTCGMSDVQFAHKVGVHKSTVGRWLARTTQPRRRQIAKIMQVTRGKVTAFDFVDAEPQQRKVA